MFNTLVIKINSNLRFILIIFSTEFPDQTDAVNNATTIQFHTSPSNQHDVQESARPNHQTRIVQLDGPNDSSDDDDDEDDDFRDNDDDHEDNDDDQNEDDNEYTGEEEVSLLID